MKNLFLTAAMSVLIAGCAVAPPHSDSSSKSKPTPAEADSTSSGTEPQPLATTTINAKAGFYQRFETELEVDADKNPRKFDADFRIVALLTTTKWNPSIYFCVRGEAPSAASCVGAVKYPNEQYPLVVERFVPTPGAQPIDSASNQYLLPTETHTVTVEFHQTQVVFKINGRQMYTRDLGKKAETFTFGCSSISCEVSLLPASAKD
ncbi:MAG: hypothetical protein ACJ8GW_01150 [Massilia sp.]